MIDIKQFGVYIIRFHFTSGINFKQRPAVIISSNGYNSSRPDVIMMPITGVEPQDDPLTPEIIDWQGAGLTKQSYFKPLITTFEQKQLISKIGDLIDKDKNTLSALIQQITIK